MTPHADDSLPATMRAAVYRGKGVVRVERLPVPVPGRGEVLIRVHTCGVCATDLKKVEHGLVPPPRVFGHETAGVIARVGPGVRGWRAGDRVAVFHHIPCKRCFYCARRQYAQCAGYKRTGTTAGFAPAGGGFAEYVLVRPWIVRRGMVRVPQSVSLEEASFIEPVNTCLKGAEKLAPRRGELVLVFGLGAIGLVYTQLVRLAGARVWGLDLFASRRALARRLGAEAAADPRGSSFPRRLYAATDGRGADGAVLAVPSQAALAQAVALTRPGARILLFAHTRKGESVALDAGAVTVEDKTLLGCYSADVDLQERTAQLVFSRRVRVKELIRRRFPLAQIGQAFAQAANPTPRSLKVVVQP